MTGSESIQILIDGLLKLKTPEEYSAFLEDVCTIKELQDIAQRFVVACKLSDGENYARISAETGASSATISRVNRCLIYGSGGYKTVIKRMNSEE